MRPGVLAGFEPYADDMRLEQLAGSGHFVCNAAPELVAERILEFVGGAGADAPTGRTLVGAHAKEMA